MLYGLTVYGPILRSIFEFETLTHDRCFKLYPESLITNQIINCYYLK